RVRLEANGAAAAKPRAEAGVFALLGGKGMTERKFDSLAQAVAGASDGDTIEIRGNGPFDIQPISIEGHALVIRAGRGFCPVIRLTRDGLANGTSMLITN